MLNLGTPMSTTTKSRGPQKKLERVADSRSITGISEKIHNKWVNTDATLKDLRDTFNQAVLKAAMKEAGMDLAPGEAEYTYNNLFGDKDSSITDKEETKMRLKSNGVDIESVTDDFINSPQTILNYLRDEYNVEKVRKTNSEDVDIEQLNEYIKPLNRRYENVVTSMVERLSKTDQLDHNNFDVTVECVVTDNVNNETKTLSDLFDGQL